MSRQHVRRERLPELQFPLLLPRYAGKLDVRQLADAQLRSRDRSFDDRRHIVISLAVDEKAQGGAAVPKGVHDILFSRCAQQLVRFLFRPVQSTKSKWPM